MKKYLLSLALLLSTSAAVAEVTIPNTFVSGQAAVATDVNENFTAVADGINANTAAIRSLRVVDGNGVDIGAFIVNDNTSLSIFTDKGFLRAYISQADGGQMVYGKRMPMYLSPNCTGQEYSETPNGNVFDNIADQRKYVPKNSQVITAVVVSYKTGGWYGSAVECMEGSYYGDGSPANLWAVYPNDPAITGAANGNYTVPLNVEMK